MPRTPKPKPPTAKEIQDALDVLFPLMEGKKAALKWPEYRWVSDPLDELRRFEKDLIRREPSHPRHQQWLDEQEERSNPENWHRR